MSLTICSFARTLRAILCKFRKTIQFCELPESTQDDERMLIALRDTSHRMEKSQVCYERGYFNDCGLLEPPSESRFDFARYLFEIIRGFSVVRTVASKLSEDIFSGTAICNHLNSFFLFEIARTEMIHSIKLIILLLVIFLFSISFITSGISRSL